MNKNKQHIRRTTTLNLHLSNQIDFATKGGKNHKIFSTKDIGNNKNDEK